MNQINTLPIEDFLNKAKLAVRSNQKNLILPIKEVIDLQHSLSVLLMKLVDNSSKSQSQPLNTEKLQAKMDGGRF